MSNNESPQTSLDHVRVFLVDDEDILAWSIETELKAIGAEVMRAASVRQALERFPLFVADVAVCDLRLPDGNGLDLLQKWRRTCPSMPVILITAHGAIDSAITALRLGAFDYLQKPFNMKDLIAAVKRASEISSLRQKVSRMQGQEIEDMDVEIVGSSPVTARLREQLHKIAKSKVNTVMITGESGTGKELAARALHAWSDRAQQPFVEINCASIPENLIESELFGFEKGAFTDARERKLGLFEVARQGTIFLDEIGEMPLALQSKLLRALEYRRFKRLGSTKDIEFSARIVAATNRRLLDEVRAGRFRADLYYRLNVLPVDLPPLRQRLQDIPELATFLIEKHAVELGIRTPVISNELIQHLQTHPFPGNIRELSNCLQRALVLFEPEVLMPHHVILDDWSAASVETLHGRAEAAPTSMHSNIARYGASSNANGQEYPIDFSDMPGSFTHNDVEPHATGVFALPEEGIKLEDLERSLLEQALEKAHSNQTKAAKLLGISRHTLRYRLEKHNLLDKESELSN